MSSRIFQLGTPLAIAVILCLSAFAAPPDGKGGGKDKGEDDGGGGGSVAAASTFFTWYDRVGGWQRIQDYSRGDAFDQDEAYLGRVYYAYGQPSELIYGTDPAYDRWFCRTGNGETLQVVQSHSDGTLERLYGVIQSEIVMVRPVPSGDYYDSINVQITNLLEDGLVVYGDSPVQWSNDGQDSFVSVIAEDISQFTIQRAVFSDGVEYPYIDLNEASRTTPKLYRLNISGADIEAGVSIDPTTGEWSFPNKFGREVAEEISLVETSIPEFEGWFSLTVEHDWSPDGTALAYRDAQDGNLYLITGLDTNSPTRRLIWQNVGSGSGIYFGVDWSPSSPLGDWIAFNGATSDGTGICLTPIDLESASPVGQTVLGMAEDDKGWGHYYFQPCWSPDGTQFASGVFQVDNRGDRVIAGSRKTDVVTGRQSDILTGSPLEYWRGNSIYTAP